MRRTDSTRIRELAHRAVGAGFDEAVKLDTFRPRYEVPGRRADGSVAGRRRLLWLAGKVLLFVRRALTGVLVIVVQIIGTLLAGDLDADVELRRRRYRVRGPRDGGALGFADANSGQQSRMFVPDLWVVWSPTRAALVRPRRAGLDVLWTAEGVDRPRFDRRSCSITWRDGSCVEWGRRTAADS